MSDRGAAAGAGVGGFIMWLSTLDLSSLSYIVGIIVAIISLIYGFYFAYRRNKREQEAHEYQIMLLLRKNKNEQ